MITVTQHFDTTKIPMPFDLILDATLLDYKNGFKLSDEITGIQGMHDLLEGVSQNSKGEYEGVMMITLEPDPVENVSEDDSYKADLEIYDALGNRVMPLKEMVYDKARKRLLFVWTGVNTNGRVVGQGSYLCIAYIDRYFDGDLKEETRKKIIGVKK
jgi:hypothetical protein